MISWKEVASPKRFFMVGTRYFASASNNWYSIWYYNYGRTWSITSLPGLVFRRRREVFIHSTNDRCEALASLKGCFLCFCFSSPVFIHWIYVSIATVKFSIYYVKNHRRMRSKVHPPDLFMGWIFTDIFELLSSIQVGLECVPEFRHSCR